MGRQPLDLDPQRATLEKALRVLQKKTRECDACPRGSGQLRYLFEGDPRAGVVFLVAAPHVGAPGVPFLSTPHGAEVTWYASLILPGSTAAVLSAVACPGLAPKPREMRACEPLWGAYLKLHRPRAVVALGSLAHDAVRPSIGFPQARMQPGRVGGILHGATYHPAVLASPQAESYRRVIAADLVRIGAALDKR